MDKKIVDVNELHVEDIPIVGGKGANLGELTNAGFPVPEAFVLTTAAYDYFIQSSDIMAKIESALEGRLQNIFRRGVVMRKKGETVAELYAERAPLYEKYAHITVDCTGQTVEQTVRAVCEALRA